MTTAVDTPFEIDLAIEQRLRAYVSAVSGALGVGWASCALDLGSPRSAYVALDRRLPSHPDRDLALLWDERQGWTAAVETHSGEDLIQVDRMGGRIVPPPAEVVRFAAGLGRRPRRARARSRSEALRSPELPNVRELPGEPAAEEPPRTPEELLALLDRHDLSAADHFWAA